MKRNVATKAQCLIVSRGWAFSNSLVSLHRIFVSHNYKSAKQLNEILFLVNTNFSYILLSHFRWKWLKIYYFILVSLSDQLYNSSSVSITAAFQYEKGIDTWCPSWKMCIRAFISASVWHISSAMLNECFNFLILNTEVIIIIVYKFGNFTLSHYHSRTNSLGRVPFWKKPRDMLDSLQFAKVIASTQTSQQLN